MKLSPRARAAQYDGQPYWLRPEDLSDEIPLEVGTYVVLATWMVPEMAGRPGVIVEVLGTEGNPYVVAVEYLVQYTNLAEQQVEFWFLPEHVEAVA